MVGAESRTDDDSIIIDAVHSRSESIREVPVVRVAVGHLQEWKGGGDGRLRGKGRFRASSGSDSLSSKKI